MSKIENDLRILLSDVADEHRRLDAESLLKKEEKPSGPININWFEADELSGGINIQFSEFFWSQLGDDREEFRDLRGNISHFSINNRTEYDPSWKIRANDICKIRLNIEYDDLNLFKYALRLFLVHEKEKGKLVIAAEELSIDLQLRKARSPKINLLSYAEKIQNFANVLEITVN